MSASQIAGYHLRSLETPFLVLSIAYDGKNPCPLRCPFSFSPFVIFLGLGSLQRTVPSEPSPTVHQVLKLAAPKLRAFDPQHEGDGIHEIRFASSIGADNGREVMKWSDRLVSPAGNRQQHCEQTICL